MSRSWQGRQFICEPVGHRLCTGTRQRPAWSRICRGRHFECEPVNYQLCPGSDRPGPGVRWIGSSYVGRFGLATPRGLSRRGCPTRQAKIHLRGSNRQVRVFVAHRDVECTSGCDVRISVVVAYWCVTPEFVETTFE